MFLITLLISGGPFLWASQIHLESLEKAAKGISTVIEAKVVSSEQGTEYLKLKNGKSGPPTQSHVTFGLENIQVLKGSLRSKTLRARFVWIVPAKYDEAGKVETTFSFSSPASGLESTVKIGTTYLFSFSHILEPETKVQSIYRIDEMKSKAELMTILNRKMKP